MPISEAKLNANRQNAQKSSGPKTEAGKARSRGNAVKHNMTGAGICLPTEDAAVLHKRIEALDEALQPRDEKESILSERAAVLAIRLKRCVEHETFTTSERVRNAVADHDARLMADVFGIVDTFHLDPAASLQKLKRSAVGVDWLISQWQAIRDTLSQFGILGAIDAMKAEQLEGRTHHSIGTSRIKALSDALHGGFSSLGTSAVAWEAVAEPEKTQAAAKIELDLRLGIEIEKLQEHRLTLPHDLFALSRLEAPQRATIDISPEGLLYRRYETAAARELHKVFAYFDEREPIEAAEDVAVTGETQETSAELGSFRKPDEAAEIEATPEADPPVEAVEILENESDSVISASLQSPGASLQWVDRPENRPNLDPEGRR